MSQREMMLGKLTQANNSVQSVVKLFLEVVDASSLEVVVKCVEHLIEHTYADKAAQKTPTTHNSTPVVLIPGLGTAGAPKTPSAPITPLASYTPKTPLVHATPKSPRSCVKRKTGRYSVTPKRLLVNIEKNSTLFISPRDSPTSLAERKTKNAPAEFTAAVASAIKLFEQSDTLDATAKITMEEPLSIWYEQAEVHGEKFAVEGTVETDLEPYIGVVKGITRGWHNGKVLIHQHKLLSDNRRKYITEGKLTTEVPIKNIKKQVSVISEDTDPDLDPNGFIVLKPGENIEAYEDKIAKDFKRARKEEEEPRSARKPSKAVEFVFGDSLRKKKGKVYYSSVIVSKTKAEYKTGDSVLVIPKSTDEPDYIATINKIWRSQEGTTFAQVMWWYRFSDLNEADQKKAKVEKKFGDFVLFKSSPVQNIPVAHIIRGCTVRIRDAIKDKDMEDYCRRPDHFYWTHWYNEREGRITDLEDDE